MRLTDAGIARLRPREREYTVWDSRVQGLGVRVRPTGARTLVMLRDVGGESRRVSLGPVSTMGIAEARKECLARQAAPEPDRETAPKRAVPLLREFIEGEWKKAHFDRYKPSTKKGVHYLLSSRILPEFGSKKLDRMTGAQLSRWFDAFSRTAPGNANHALALLRQIMNFAVACGYIEKNPTQGIRPNRRPRGLPASCRVRRSVVCTGFWTHRPERTIGSRRISFAFFCSPDAARVRSCASAGPRSIATRSSSQTARRARERFPSTARPGASSNGNRETQVASCSRRRAIRIGRTATISHCGTGFAARPVSRMSAFTTSVIPMRATRS